MVQYIAFFSYQLVKLTRMERIMKEKKDAMQELIQRFSQKKWKYALGITVSTVLIIVILIFIFSILNKPVLEIDSSSTLDKIVNISDLSTFQTVYNGVAKVTNEENPNEIEYYVAYDSKIKTGIDFSKVEIQRDDKKKTIMVTLPEIKITDINVDITSLEFIFEDDDANTSTVVEEAHKKCIEDATNESKDKKEIYNLAYQNAKNIIKAIMNPLVEQFDEEYKLQIN